MIHQYTVAHFSTWIGILLRHGVSILQIPRAVIISIVSFLLIPIHIANYLIYKNKKRLITNTKDPIFIIGHWRSGTTYLHYLMGKDDQFGYLSYYQAFMPTLIWAGGKYLQRFLSRLLPKTRFQDNVIVRSNLPTEEESPLTTMSIYSACHSFFFPKEEQYYDKYILYKDITKNEKIKWRKAYSFIISQIQARFPHRRLLIKNPHNTGRVKELIEIYPEAKFIFLHRSAYGVIPSTIRMYDKIISKQYLQTYSRQDTEDKIFYYHNTMIKRYIETKDLIPPDQLIELSYEQLLSESQRSIQKIYSQFELELSNEAQQEIKNFIQENQNYVANVHQNAKKLNDRIKDELSWFEEWREHL